MQPFATTAMGETSRLPWMFVRQNELKQCAMPSSMICWLFDDTPSFSTFVCDEHQAPSSWRGAGCLSCLHKTKANKNCVMGLLDQRF